MFTDVDGVYDCDPNVYGDEACKLGKITASELLAMEDCPQVIQREALQYACERGVNIWVRSAFEPEKDGTLIICR